MKEKVKVKQKAKNIDKQSTLELIYEEVRSLSQTYLRLIEALSSKASTLFGFAAVIIGICASLSQHLIDKMEPVPEFFFLVGVGAIGISAFLSLWAYKVREVAVGARIKNLPKKIEKIDSIKREKILKKICVAYDECIDENRRRLDKLGLCLKISFWAMFIGICLLAISIFETAYLKL